MTHFGRAGLLARCSRGTWPARASSSVLSHPAHRTSCAQPYCISFDCVTYGSIFHQCVYVLCKTEAATMQVHLSPASGGGWHAVHVHASDQRQGMQPCFA